MLTCPRCGALCEREDRYCGACGERVSDTLRDVEGRMTQKIMNLTDIRYKLGLVYYKKGDLSNAIRTWQKILDEDPDHSDVSALIRKAEVERASLYPSE